MIKRTTTEALNSNLILDTTTSNRIDSILLVVGMLVFTILMFTMVNSARQTTTKQTVATITVLNADNCATDLECELVASH